MKSLMTTAAALLLTVSTATVAASPKKPAAAKAQATTLQGTCNAEGAKPLIGSKAEGGNVEQARVLAGADSFRIIRPGDSTQNVAADPGRLNIKVDAQEVMTEFTCG